MFIAEFIKKVRFDKGADRIGPDIPFTHWRLYFRSFMQKLCKKKFGYWGENADFRPGAYAVVCSKISIGSNVVIRPGTMLFADERSSGPSIVIENDVLLGSGIHIYVNNHRFVKRNGKICQDDHTFPENVILREGCWVGANVIILPGVEIGAYAIVGAGSVVTKTIPSGCVAVGNPAKVIRTI